MSEQKEITLKIPDESTMALIAGPADANIKLVQQAFSSRITIRGDEIRLSGDQVELDSLVALFSDLIERAKSGHPVDEEHVMHLLELLKSSEMAPKTLRDDVILSFRGQAIRPKTAGQKEYVDAIRKNQITFAIGPAGTGKTYLAMAMAVDALNRKKVGRIILSRPIVEAGENLGFLPGTLTEKVDPYIRPLYDALFSMMDAEKANAYLETGVIEIAPLAFMRGRTLNDAFVILDEAQNTTPEQMKMFLTRLGFASKMIITGDVTQIDISRGKSGLREVKGILEGIGGIAFCEFDGKDVIRNSLVREIISAYERAETSKLQIKTQGSR